MVLLRYDADGGALVFETGNPEDQLSEDLLKRDFKATEPNKKWLGDITQTVCKDGKLCISGVSDCIDGALVGPSMQDHVRTELCVSALDSAAERYGHPPGLIFHSDRGRQYRQRLDKNGIRQSMVPALASTTPEWSRFGPPSRRSSSTGSLSILTRCQVRSIVFRWVKGHHNTIRPYSANPDFLPLLA